MPAPEFLTPKTLPPPVGYSHIAKSNGLPIAYIAGQVPCDASGALVGEGNFKAQVEQVFKNLKIAVEAAGGSMHDLLKLNYYFVASVDRSEQPALREVRDRYVNVAAPPASTPPGAAGLAGRDRGGGGVARVRPDVDGPI